MNNYYSIGKEWMMDLITVPVLLTNILFNEIGSLSMWIYTQITLVAARRFLFDAIIKLTPPHLSRNLSWKTEVTVPSDLFSKWFAQIVSSAKKSHRLQEALPRKKEAEATIPVTLFLNQ